MFGWFTKSKSPSPDKDQPESANSPKKQVQETGKLNRDDVVRQAMENARLAREAIGPENLARMMQLMEEKKKHSEFAKAKEIIEKLDKGRLSDNLKYMMHGEEGSHPDPRRNAGRTSYKSDNQEKPKK